MVAQENCVQDVDNGFSHFVVNIQWEYGRNLRISAQNTTDSLALRSGREPIIITGTPVLSFTNCYVKSIDSGFEYTCFKGNGLVIDGPSPELGQGDLSMGH
ncbi:hypothetical protein GCM10007939_06530 [Amylibacter marinus]|uniref:Uncharacterized protein n=2 Tax=Amylibacter marinus TaxID=1475483 RepID=A0ABQ5VSG7_9RHOB|nr:hypothetical protein GCM10007939_06530 [Amylibacter marinus]